MVVYVWTVFYTHAYLYNNSQEVLHPVHYILVTVHKLDFTEQIRISVPYIYRINYYVQKREFVCIPSRTFLLTLLTDIFFCHL